MACSTIQQFHLPMPDGDSVLSFVGPTPEWDIYKSRFGNFHDGEDIDIIYEMMDAAEEEHNKELDRKIRILGEALDALDHCEDTKWYKRSDSWTRTLPGEDESEWPLHRVWAHFMLWPLNYSEKGDEIEEVLQAAEEDFDYEAWISSKQYVKSLEEYNMHKLLAFVKGESPHWVGECTGDMAVSTVITSEGSAARSDTRVPTEKCVLYNTFLKDRFKVGAIIRTEFPGNKKGYAKASSPFGDIYIPNRFNGYIGQPGSPQLMTVALQDVGSGDRKGNGFRWTCIYTH